MTTDIEPEITAAFGLRVIGRAACPECGQECEEFQIFGQTKFDCESCTSAAKARRINEERRTDCLRTWLDVAPVDMQKPIMADLLAPYVAPAMELDGREGAGFAGSTGGGKTRVAFHLLKQAANHGKKPYYCSASRYRQAAAGRHDNNLDVRARNQAVIDAARHCGALLLDDIGKGSNSAAGDEALFELLDHRRNNRKLTFWTANGGSQWLQEKLGADYGPAIVRRMLDLVGWSGKGTGRLFVEEKNQPTTPTP